MAGFPIILNAHILQAKNQAQPYREKRATSYSPMMSIRRINNLKSLKIGNIFRKEQ